MEFDGRTPRGSVVNLMRRHRYVPDIIEARSTHHLNNVRHILSGCCATAATEANNALAKPVKLN